MRQVPAGAGGGCKPGRPRRSAAGRQRARPGAAHGGPEGHGRRQGRPGRPRRRLWGQLPAQVRGGGRLPCTHSSNLLARSLTPRGCGCLTAHHGQGQGTRCWGCTCSAKMRSPGKNEGPVWVGLSLPLPAGAAEAGTGGGRGGRGGDRSGLGNLGMGMDLRSGMGSGMGRGRGDVRHALLSYSCTSVLSPTVRCTRPHAGSSRGARGKNTLQDWTPAAWPSFCCQLLRPACMLAVSASTRWLPRGRLCRLRARTAQRQTVLQVPSCQGLTW